MSKSEARAFPAYGLGFFSMSFASCLDRARAARALDRARARAFRKTFAALSALSPRDLDDIGVSVHLVRDVAAEASLSAAADPGERVSLASITDYAMSLVDASLVQIGRLLAPVLPGGGARPSSAARRDADGHEGGHDGVVRDLIAARSRGFATRA